MAQFLSDASTVGVLVGAWVLTPKRLTAFRSRAIKLLPSLAPRERLAMHWCLLMAVYPFFGDVACHVGRTLFLQSDFSLAHLTSRMRREWGDRSTVDRSTQRIVRSMVDWGALRDTGMRGVYRPIQEPATLSSDASKLVLEGFLHYAQRPLPIDEALRHPGLFPFALALRPYDLRGSSLFELLRLGFDVDMVGIRQTTG